MFRRQLDEGHDLAGPPMFGRAVKEACFVRFMQPPLSLAGGVEALEA